MNAEREKDLESLEIGMYVMRQPQTIFDADEKGRKQQTIMRGRVCYIHPKGRFHTVAFDVRGGTVRESFPGVAV